VVNAALSLGGLVGVALSAGFVFWEVGRYAAPQVERSRFDERKEIFAYTAGLFVGVPLAVPLLFYFSALSVGAWIPSAVVDLALLIGGSELALVLFLRSDYFGAERARPFYALGFRAGNAGILTLALVAAYLGGPNALTAGGVALVLAQSVAVVALEVATALLALGARRPRLGSVVFGGAGFVLLGFGETAGVSIGIVAAALVVAGTFALYRRLRPSVLDTVPPVRLRESARTRGGDRSRFGRTDREPADRP
jgi:hypothetical protein